ncbi:excinuclease ABC subunit UvrC [Butyricicoccus pullicaecorum]|uniref:UvrABC system protein C n=1 Tax=Butyricicoccus pullicaecorum 1.2 TaxID=1203606 RepID=R8VTD2_9FIRM|nr:excinuclease ABC subunit UvrC [Butyricicoccus pullicaecorum]EOQ35980.1 excinuclease ABC subunit C [Butyricicoccus pullicaecorum 1.2]SKA61257.1 Excinuclease ABC subunit C [Butyricicoccus pullicaecorum DSM 23266]
MSERFEELKAKVLSLPFEPGVYIMKNRDGQVIYVGKAKALKNRVSQYFQSDSRHSPKTIRMVSNIWDFDIIVTETEFEALVLENQMIKKYQPKYNILLKDDKGYPFIKVTTSKPYPSFSIVPKPGHDADRYFGPYTSRRAAYHAIDTINETLKLKTCRRVFPRDIGKDRPCLNLHLGRCIAPCTGQVSAEEYAARVQEGISLLEGNDKALLADLTARMEQAAEDLRFEQAATLRDRIRAVRALGEKQKVVAGAFAELDAVAYVQGQTRGCVVVLHYLAGDLHDKEFTLLDGVTAADAGEALGAFLKQYYALRGAVPRTVLLSSPIDESEAVGEFLSSIAERKVELAVPQRGRRHDIIRLAEKNAREEILRVETSQERRVKSLELLGQMTGMDELPHILEAYDISNFAGQDTVGSMVVFEDAKPARSRYRKFRIETAAQGQDDYASMTEMLTRRLQRWKDGDEKFTPLPSAFLIDGGLGHVRTAQRVLDQFGVTTPCFGMVKDDHHRTRGLVAPDGREFGISTVPAVFALIGRIQEEVHRFAITYNRALGAKKVRGSSLDQIEGVGEKRRNDLLKHFSTIENIRAASVDELARVVPRTVAENVHDYYEKRAKKEK